MMITYDDNPTSSKITNINDVDNSEIILIDIIEMIYVDESKQNLKENFDEIDTLNVKSIERTDNTEHTFSDNTIFEVENLNNDSFGLN